MRIELVPQYHNLLPTTHRNIYIREPFLVTSYSVTHVLSGGAHMHKRMIIGLTLALMLFLMAGMVSALSASRVVGKYSENGKLLGKGKYYAVKQGEHRSEQIAVSLIDTPVAGQESTRWHARQTSTPIASKRQLKSSARPHKGFRYGLTVPEEKERIKPYSRRTLGSSQVNDPAVRRGRFYRSSGNLEPTFTDLLTGKKMR